jgi:NAD-dependent deacetylase
MILSKIERARNILQRSRRLCILTGAGLSAPSGIPTFRGVGGLWKQRGLLSYAFPEAFASDPQGCLEVYERARQQMNACDPNNGHRAICALRERHDIDLFTQNVDGLHARVGDDAKEIHGSMHALRCMDPLCHHRIPLAHGTPIETVHCPQCGSRLRHDVVLFGEPVRHMDEMREALIYADAVLLVGTSGLVTDTRTIAREMREREKPVIEINPAWLTRATWWTTLSIRESAHLALPALAA